MRLFKGAPLVFSVLAISLPAQTPAPIRGFPQSSIAEEQKLETELQSIPDSARLRAYMEHMAGQAHLAGSPRSRAVAEYILARLKEWGLDAQIEQFEALMP